MRLTLFKYMLVLLTGWSGIMVTAVASAADPLNLARQFGVVSQGADYDSGSAASLAIDGNTSTFNHTTCDVKNNWWQVRLPDPTQISRIVVSSRSTWTSRIAGAGVYISDVPYNGTLNESDRVATLKAVATAQATEFNPMKTGRYVIVKATDNNCLHMSEVEVYGSAPAAPYLDQAAYHFQLSNSSTVGTLLGKVKAVDYQLESLRYTLEGGVPFAIDGQGNMTVRGALKAGKTYTFNVTASDGVNVSRAPVTVRVTSLVAVEDALRTGKITGVTSGELLDASIAEVASRKTVSSLLASLYGTGGIAYKPGHSTQLLDLNVWVDSVFPIVMGAKGNVLAMGGTTATARYAAFGTPPTDLFKNSESLSFETPFSHLLAWLLAGEPVNTAILSDSRTVALSMTSSDSRSNFKAWITQKLPAWRVVDCNTVADLASCYSAATMVVTDGGSNSADAPVIKQVLTDVLAAGKPVLYLHTGTWGANDVSHAIASLMNFSLPYGGNWWADDAANWAGVAAMQSAMWENQGLNGIETMLKHFKANDYTMTGLDTGFYPGANKVRSILTGLDERKINLFAMGGSRLYRLLALLGDSYRATVSFPMDQNSTDVNVFLKSLFADHAVYNYRLVNPVQPDMGNFSRSDFSHVTPLKKTVKMTSRQSFRAAGVYALPGKTFRVTRTDKSNTTTKVFVNTLRSGSTHEFEAWGYKRPKYLQSAHIPLQSGETIAITSPYGGPIQIEFSTNDKQVSLIFQDVGEHPFWDDATDNASFTTKLAAGDYDWAEFVTPAFEIHSTLEKMRTSASDARWGGTLEGFSAATMRYTHNFPHVLAGFKGPGIDVVPEIHQFAIDNRYTIENLDLVKHMNADQATCGYGCSGNPYDAYWSFEPIGHGDIHELGHGLEKWRLRFADWEVHTMTNPYSYYTKSQYFKTTGGDPDCQSLPFQKAFTVLQASRKQTNPSAYVQANLWGTMGWSEGAAMFIQMMMAVEDQGALKDGWHLLARLHIMEREFSRATAGTEEQWRAKRGGLGFSLYTLTEAKDLSQNDWLLVATSYATRLDMRAYFGMWALPVSSKATKQVAGKGYPLMPRNFYISSGTGYCKGEGFDGNKLPVDGNQVWP